MSIPEDGYLSRIFLGESDKHDGKPLYEWLVLKARDAGLAGADPHAKPGTSGAGE